ncbi:NAD-P-binding protein [Peniophora sp. CONT]|nr:NAD-P-binding protein [Peniophora sp. CONT]
MSFISNIKGFEETLPVALHHDVYPSVDPASHFANQTFSGKVVLVTGASRGIGAVVAKQYAQAGAAVALVARSAESLKTAKAAILAETPGARVLTFAVDVKDPAAAERAVEETVSQLGGLDVLIANAGTALSDADKRIGERKDPLAWWNSFEVNLFGVYNFVRPALKHLEQRAGYAIVVSSVSAQLRFPNSSDYGVSKHAIGRLVEYIALEYPRVKSFAVHPGTIDTDLSRSFGLPSEFFTETPELTSAIFIALSSGRLDWLSGRFFDARWDIDEVEQLKEKILEKDALVSKLVVRLD